MTDFTEKEQIEGWSKLDGRPISEQEYKNICNNLNDFFSVLKKWNDKEKLEDEGNCGLRSSNNSGQA